MRSYFRDVLHPEDDFAPDFGFATQEAEDAVIRVQRNVEPSELSPQNPYIRRLQHELVYGHGLYSESKGKAPFRRVVVFPREV